MSVERGPGTIAARGDHFFVRFDLARGGEIGELQLHDGSRWNVIFAAPAITFPAVRFSDEANEYALSNDHEAKLADLADTPEKISLRVLATPRAADGRPGGWSIALAWEVYPEGAVFLDLDCERKGGAFCLCRASTSFRVADAIRKAARYREEVHSQRVNSFPCARVAIGTRPARSFTNEIEVIVEHKKAITGSPGFEQKDGSFTWILGGDETVLSTPPRYYNRIALFLGAAATRKPRSNVIGHRVYHWVNFLDTQNWFPTDEQIDKMAARGGTMLILHHEWMRQRGSNGHPHADYTVVRSPESMTRTIARAHSKGMRVGLYMRGVEMYALKTDFFAKHCRRDWDGLYVDWHGPVALSYHEGRYRPETQLGDTHFSSDGSYIPARGYFLFTKKLRETVGAGGFLIGHQGSFNSGIGANLCFDAYLPGETRSDWDMLADRDRAVFKGMMAGGACMPWMLDSPAYRTPEGVAKMAAWGLYPHIVLGLGPPRAKSLFPCEPDDPLYDYILPYWRILAHADIERAAVYNLPSDSRVAVTSSQPDIHSVVYRTADDTYLLIAANLAAQPGKAVLTLNTKLLEMAGEYRIVRVDAATGRANACKPTADVLTTSRIPPWGIEGFKLSKR